MTFLQSDPTTAHDTQTPSGNNPHSYKLRRSFTVEDMRRFAFEAWGQLGASAVMKWAEFNDAYFDGALRPVPLVFTQTLPFGKAIAFCSYGDQDKPGRTITLNVPWHGDFLVADNGTLLHEMIHQYLFERGEYPKHDGDGWRREIMRINKMINGSEIWAGKYTTTRVDLGEATKRVVRINKPSRNGQPSLTQMQIARWPHDRDIDLGKLGCSV
jgi:hypothetical protein